jgi:uncharacterized membrane protein YphA (DoxX/SURF4 family)
MNPQIPQKAPYKVEVTAGQSYYWCSCGLSKNQPFCDGSHKTTEFTPVKFTAEKTETVYFCGCKHSANGAVEVFGGIALILGYQTRLVAISLAVFTVLASIAGHAFWAAPADAAFIAQLLFFKNIAVTGGLLILASSGAGSISLDSRRAKA